MPDAPHLKPRPTSPHLSIYRPQITSVLSIFHRMTGIVLSVGLLFLVWWLLAIQYGPNAYEHFTDFTRSILGIVFMVGWTLSLFYHMLNGIRHLFWDMGIGYRMETVTQTGMMVLIGAGVLTAIVWVLAMTGVPQISGAMHG